MNAKEIKRIDLLKNETFWTESLENAAYAETYSKSTSKDPMKAMMFKAVYLMNELVAELEAKSKEDTKFITLVSDNRIEIAWGNHCEIPYPDKPQKMNIHGFKGAIKELAAFGKEGEG
ncbi:MAG: hypothetical protein ACTSQF_10865 [Candidatus Heimdallarchaeaceae archaeon]